MSQPALHPDETHKIDSWDGLLATDLSTLRPSVCYKVGVKQEAACSWGLNDSLLFGQSNKTPIQVRICWNNTWPCPPINYHYLGSALQALFLSTRSSGISWCGLSVPLLLVQSRKVIYCGCPPVVRRWLSAPVDLLISTFRWQQIIISY